MTSSHSYSSEGQYLEKAQEFELLRRPLPPLSSNDVLIEPRAVTLCGSDNHYFQKACNGSIKIREPLCLGHEFAGKIIDVGSEVRDRKIGDRVAIEPGVACGECDVCRDGRYNLCGNLRFRGSGSAWPHFQGGLQEKVVHPAAWTHRLPPELMYEEGALIEPLAVAVHACRRANIKPGSSCIIIGAGAVGLLCAVAARLEGCTRITIADIVESRINFAVNHGFAQAGFLVPGKRHSDPTEQLHAAEDIAKSMSQIKFPDGLPVDRADYVLECTGVEICTQTSIYATKPGGKTVIVGMGTPNHNLPLSHAGAREIDIMSIWRYADCYPRAIQIMQESKKNESVAKIAKMITHRFEGLANVPAAFRCASRSQDESGRMVIKVVVSTEESGDIEVDC
ncbi:hypothetical protein D0867_07437 [Hortaea werneckii]|uniref:Enoyl reductase (ER) domain-containing protein n=1 Tax=Hortaea werneckii TaxID=91943 RepID=A0A3M6ZEI6_HORWE|nr:hypothetical protein D0867_07437 [Hortaea werneckii]RMY30761.1 hypothetical protein D0866_07777 [Hortaea werneckii]